MTCGGSNLPICTPEIRLAKIDAKKHKNQPHVMGQTCLRTCGAVQISGLECQFWILKAQSSPHAREQTCPMTLGGATSADLHVSFMFDQTQNPPHVMGQTCPITWGPKSPDLNVSLT